MLTIARDLLAVMFLEKRLSLLREEHLEHLLSGASMDKNFIKRREQKILLDIKRHFFSAPLRNFVRYPNSQKLSDKEDFADRSQKLTERAIIMSHRKLLTIPCVGQEEYSEL